MHGKKRLREFLRPQSPLPPPPPKKGQEEKLKSYKLQLTQKKMKKDEEGTTCHLFLMQELRRLKQNQQDAISKENKKRFILYRLEFVQMNHV